MQPKFMELVALEGKLEQLQEQERQASVKATAAWAAVSTMPAAGRPRGQRGAREGASVAPDDPGFAFLMQFESLDSKLAVSLRSLMATRDGLLQPRADESGDECSDDGADMVDAPEPATWARDPAVSVCRGSRAGHLWRRCA